MNLQVNRSFVWGLAAALLIFLSSCSILTTESEKSSVSFTLDSSAVAKIRAAALGCDVESAGSPNMRAATLPENLYIDISLKGEHEETKSFVVKEGESVTFEEIPVGTEIYAEAFAYLKTEDNEKQPLYRGTSERLKVTNGDNKLSLSLKRIYAVSLIDLDFTDDEVKYTVKHLQQNVDDDDYTEVIADRESSALSESGELPEVEPKDYEGFHLRSFKQLAIDDEKNVVVEVKYDRNVYSVEYSDGLESLELETIPAAGEYRFGATFTPDFEGFSTVPGYTFAGWKNGDSIYKADGTRSFTVKQDVLLDAQWALTIKNAPDSVGDIVFNDGKAVEGGNILSELGGLSEELKAKAIALIFYIGTECNNSVNGEPDNTTERMLGVGFNYGSRLAWCSSSANAYSIDITALSCTDDGSSGFKDGRQALETMGKFLADNESTDDTTGDGSENKYPAFYYAKNYGQTQENIKGTSYENGWYLPTYPEFTKFNKNSTIQLMKLVLESPIRSNSAYQFWTSSSYDAQYARLHANYYQKDAVQSTDLTLNGYRISYVYPIRQFN